MEMTDQNYELKTLFWEATLRCNAKCEFCGSRCGEDKQNQLKASELSRDEICTCLKEIAECYDAREIMLNVTGGEPLLREDLFDVMAYASNLGFPWGVVTNGTLITEKTVEAMKTSGMKTISISLDGLPETHDSLRNIRGGFGKIENAVKSLKDADFLDEIQITTVVNHKNIREMDELFLYIQNMGVDSWRLAIVDPIGRACDNRNLLLSEEELKRYFAFFKKYQFNGKVVLTTSCSHFLGNRDNLYRTHSFACEAGKTVASILANGDIFVCPNVERRPELIQGNIKKDSFCRIWNQRFQWFRDERRQSNPECASCEYWKRCLGDSLHTWDFMKKRPKFCWKEQRPDEEWAKDDSRKIVNLVKPFYMNLRGFRISYQSSSTFRVFLMPDAAEEMRILFAWGKNHPRNKSELLAGLAGHIVDGNFLIEAVIPGRLEKRTQVEAFFSEECYTELLEEVEIMNSCRTETDPQYNIVSQPFQLLGIAHTHPNELETVMSLPDMKLHDMMLKKHAHFLSVILNPQKKILCAYYDSIYSPIDIEILAESGKEWF